MTTTYNYINNTNQHQHKLRNPKKIARNCALSAPKYRAQWRSAVVTKWERRPR